MMREVVQCDAKDGENLKQKHSQIAKAAAKLFIQKGFHKTSMREVARAVGMPLSSLYHYITSKDDVLYLVYGELYNIWADGLARLSIEKIKDPVKKLKAVMSVMLKTSYDNKDLMQMTFRESKFLNKTALRKILSTESKYIETVVDIVKEGKESGVFNNVDPAIIGNYIAYNSFFYPLRGWYFRGNLTFEELESQIIDFTLNAILPPTR